MYQIMYAFPITPCTIHGTVGHTSIQVRAARTSDHGQVIRMSLCPMKSHYFVRNYPADMSVGPRRAIFHFADRTVRVRVPYRMSPCRRLTSSDLTSDLKCQRGCPGHSPLLSCCESLVRLRGTVGCGRLTLDAETWGVGAET